ncbi:uncharacterized protein LOC131430183 [Malaya genurostris]|uniref:uncharacterized protein LOC131430183 n=1 Tax=Malaya genurostris TaxID=325434 RepID=UPI0026F3C910|nr:uncharacterized protein LOC131430183 [Malaya genurostris]
MGGCRCTFRECENSTTSKPGMHFFHYPIRDWPRLEKWAINADKREFKMLALSKLKNRVVCEDHFRNEMFMNYLKESLIKTAVPTLDVLDDGRVWDVETNSIDEREEWVIPNKQKPERSKEKESSLIVPMQTDNATMQIQFLDAEQSKIEISSVGSRQPKLLNKDPHPLPVAGSSQTTSTVLRKLVFKRKKSTSEEKTAQKVQVLSIQRVKKPFSNIEQIEHFENCVPCDDMPASALPSSSTDETIILDQPDPIIQTAVSTVIDPALLEKLEQNSREISELKGLLKEALNKPAPEPKVITVEVPTIVPAPAAAINNNSSPKLEKGPHMNKVQLFNGIKRYLNPTMVALLRMELFGGSAEREWKTDEKSLAVELLGMGDNVYDHFCEEFRFRLPSKKDVQKWNEQELNDDDAS